jgi:hypothetical protein
MVEMAMAEKATALAVAHRGMATVALEMALEMAPETEMVTASARP